MHETAICAHRQDFNTQGLVFIVSGSNRCQFRRSDKGKISRIETEDNPFTFKVREFDGEETFTGNEGT
jgi:hypothetical protein